jgi:hypothetical protein
MLDELIHDLCYAVRQSGRFPGFTTVALLALALGVGATITVFKVVNAILVNPLPFERAGELHVARLPYCSPAIARLPLACLLLTSDLSAPV